jgi:hypothetical protein
MSSLKRSASIDHTSTNTKRVTFNLGHKRANTSVHFEYKNTGRYIELKFSKFLLILTKRKEIYSS